MEALNKRLRDKFGLKKKIDGYKKINELASDNFFKNMKMNKRGQILDIIAIIMLLGIALILFGVVNLGLEKFNTTIQATETDTTITNYASDKATGVPSWFDFAFTFFFFMVLLILILINFTLDVNIALIIFYLFTFFILDAICKGGHNMMYGISQAFPTVMTNMPLTNFIVDNFYIIMALFYVVLFIMLFLKPKEVR